jgi:hypothetical protein
MTYLNIQMISVQKIKCDVIEAKTGLEHTVYKSAWATLLEHSDIVIKKGLYPLHQSSLSL